MAAIAYNKIAWRIINAIEAGAETLAKILLGDPTLAKLEYPETGALKVSMDRGQLWSETLVPTILSHTGAYLDSWGIAVGHISTNATGVSPTLNWGTHISLVTKDEVANSITVNFETGYANATYVVFANIPNLLANCLTVGLSTANAEIYFWDPTSGVPITINNRTVYFLAFGQR